MLEGIAASSDLAHTRDDSGLGARGDRQVGAASIFTYGCRWIEIHVSFGGAMAGGGYGGRHVAEEKGFTARARLCFAVAVACALACICVFLAIGGRCSEEEVRALAPAAAAEAAAEEEGVSLRRIVFGVAASAKLWDARRRYVREWWRAGEMRGFVWLDERVNAAWTEAIPFKVSASTSQFKYSRRRGNRAAIRLSRIVTETVRLGLEDVDWIVVGDDDTVFFTDNLVRVLARYDPTRMYYIGGQSESHVQNTLFSYGMAYGGGGVAVSFALAKALAGMQDGCLHRYPDLYGSDDRMHACITELGVPITKNQGFHQFDICGDPMGLLAAHPLTPLVSIHHLDVVKSLFPRQNRLAAVQHLMRAARVDQASMLQQTITYSHRRQFSFSVSAGYVVRVYRGYVPPWQLQEVPRTFYSWYRSKKSNHFPFNVREIPKEPCLQPALFFLSDRTSSNSSELIETVYKKEHYKPALKLKGCDHDALISVEHILVRSAPLNQALFEPRRLCGKVAKWRKDTIEINIRPCEPGELLIGPD